MRKILLLLGAMSLSMAARAQSEARPEILVLGTYHMSNPGRDVYNMPRGRCPIACSPARNRAADRSLEEISSD
jgi:hypothetical protein